MAIHTKWHQMLVASTKSKQPAYDLEADGALTPRDILQREGFRDVDMESVAVVINDEQAKMDDAISDGDTVEFMVSVQGGAQA